MTKGLVIPQLPYGKLNLVGTLLFKEYPSTLVYSDLNGIPCILEWVDVNSLNENRFILFKSSVSDLKKYIIGQISHYDLILGAEGDLVTVFDGAVSTPKRIEVLSVRRIQDDYLPSMESYFKQEDSEEVGEIISFFNLGNYEEPLDYSINYVSEQPIEYHSAKFKTELFRMHLNDGQYVKHGRVQTDILGNTLTSFEGLYHEIANDYVRGKDRARKISKGEKSEYDRIANTEVVIKEAASFSVYIRPQSGQSILNFDGIGESSLIAAGETIFHDVLDVIHNAGSSQQISIIQEKYNRMVFVRLKEFAEHVKRNDLSIDLDYFSPVSKNKWTNRIDIVSADNIITTIENTTINPGENKFDVTGRFSALNCRTAHFTFISNEEEEFTGYFDDLLREGVSSLTFVDLYVITISRDESKNITDIDSKHNDKILAVIKKV